MDNTAGHVAEARRREFSLLIDSNYRQKGPGSCAGAELSDNVWGRSRGSEEVDRLPRPRETHVCVLELDPT